MTDTPTDDTPEDPADTADAAKRPRWQRLALGCFGSAALLVAVLFFGGFLIDPAISLETQATLDAPAERTFELLSTTDGVVAWWSGFQGLEVKALNDETVEFRAGGHLIETWTRTQVRPGTHAIWSVDFAGMLVVTRVLSVKPVDGKLRVGWAESGQLDNPFLRWMTVLMPPEWTIDKFQKALTLLEERARQ